MPSVPEPIKILIAEDDPDDRLLILRALDRSHLRNEIRVVEDGEQLLDYLRRDGRYAEPASAPRPDLILLDLNMPRKSGREALREIKSDPVLRSIPVLVLTTSDAEADVLESYNGGANAYVTKPVTFEGLVSAVRRIDQFWLQIVKLPRVA